MTRIILTMSILQLLKFVGIILINIGLNLFTSLIPINIYADFIIFIGILFLSFNIKLNFKEK